MIWFIGSRVRPSGAKNPATKRAAVCVQKVHPFEGSAQTQRRWRRHCDLETGQPSFRQLVATVVIGLFCIHQISDPNETTSSKQVAMFSSLTSSHSALLDITIHLLGQTPDGWVAQPPNRRIEARFRELSIPWTTGCQPFPNTP
jgi:hypothetical protein